VHDRSQVARAWVPWILLSVLLFIWGLPQTKDFLNGDYSVQTLAGKVSAHHGSTKIEVPGTHLHNVVLRAYPVVPQPTPERPTPPEKAVFILNWLSATGSCILVSAVLAGLLMGFRFRELIRVYWATLIRVRYSLITIAGMLALGYVPPFTHMLVK
jgi:lactate permease